MSHQGGKGACNYYVNLGAVEIRIQAATISIFMTYIKLLTSISMALQLHTFTAFSSSCASSWYHHTNTMVSCFKTQSLLVLNLIVQVASEPIIEERFLHITCASQLHGHPVLTFVQVYVHGDVVGLSTPDKPVALQETNEKVPAKTCPEPTQQRGIYQVETVVEEKHACKILRKRRSSLVTIFQNLLVSLENEQTFHFLFFKVQQTTST